MLRAAPEDNTSSDSQATTAVPVTHPSQTALKQESANKTQLAASPLLDVSFHHYLNLPLPLLFIISSYLHLPLFHRYADLPLPLLALIATFWNQRELHQWSLAMIGADKDSILRSFAVSTEQKVSITPRTLFEVKEPHPYKTMKSFLHRQFKVVLKEAKLVNDVFFADYEQARNAVDEDPSLMLKHVYFQYRDGSSDTISPLKLAFKLYDTYMWKMFYDKIKNNPEQLAEFEKQLQEQNSYLELEPLFDAYEKYVRHPESGKNEAWLKLGALQRKLLPIHMVKEFSRKGNEWKTDSTFDVRGVPAPMPNKCQLFDYHEISWRSLSSILLDKTDRGWKGPFTLIRGRRDRGVMAPGYEQAVYNFVTDDLATFRRLFEQRTEELAIQISLLPQNAHENAQVLSERMRFLSNHTPS